MYCNKCGAKLSNGSIYCSNCGAKVEHGSDGQPESAKANSEKTNGNSFRKEKKNPISFLENKIENPVVLRIVKILWLVIRVALFIAMFAGAIIGLMYLVALLEQGKTWAGTILSAIFAASNFLLLKDEMKNKDRGMNKILFGSVMVICILLMLFSIFAWITG